MCKFVIVCLSRRYVIPDLDSNLSLKRVGETISCLILVALREIKLILCSTKLLQNYLLTNIKVNKFSPTKLGTHLSSLDSVFYL